MLGSMLVKGAPGVHIPGHMVETRFDISRASVGGKMSGEKEKMRYLTHDTLIQYEEGIDNKTSKNERNFHMK